MQYYLIAPTIRAHNEGLFTYHSEEKLSLGTLVMVEVGKRKTPGVVMKKMEKPKFPTKPIAQIIEPVPLPPPLLSLATWLSSYYVSPLSAVWQTILPSGSNKKRQKNTVEIPLNVQRKKQSFSLNTDQQAAVNQILSNDHTTHLLQGVTGSGKTAVYMELAKKTLHESGKSVFILVPEIALTSQLIAEFSAEFNNIIVTHSRLTEAERHIIWKEVLKSDQPRLIIGPRSALFMPARKLGLIVIDEAHEPSFKQEQSPRYSALRAAKILADHHHAKLVLGSATPSIVDRYLAEQSHSDIIRLDKSAKITGEVTIKKIDSKKREHFSKHRFLSNELLQHITLTLQKKQQVLLFHNRRGSAPTTLCENCGWSAICQRCFIPLTLHTDIHKLLCHLCGRKEEIPTSCPTCHHTSVIHKGVGTKMIAEEISKQFPSARIARFDGDNESDKTLEKMYQEVYDGTIDIIIGTQVVAKGLDLPRLSLVGVIQADNGLSMPDFGTNERVFQLLYQVIGRVGRDEKLSTIIVQSFQPDHYAVTAALSRDFEAFYTHEITKRKQEIFPPFTHLLKLTCTYKSEKGASQAALKLKKTLQDTNTPNVAFFGPTPAFYERSRDNYRWQVIIKSPARSNLVALLKHLPPTKWQAELDPMSLL